MQNHIQQIYYYITLDCNLRCRHCYVGDQLAPNAFADLPEIAETLQRYHAQGTRKVIFLGGEPTLHPAYEEIINRAAEIGFENIIIDTNGTANDPVPQNFPFLERLTIRFGFEGIDAQQHDAMRGTGTFKKALSCLRHVVLNNIRTEITITLHSGNIPNIKGFVEFFANEGVNEINFHFMSVMGHAQKKFNNGLNSVDILTAQAILQKLESKPGISLRYPKLLLTQDEMNQALENGFRCRVIDPAVELIFPDGMTYNCPLEIGAGSFDKAQLRRNTQWNGCPLSFRLLPQGIPGDYVMSCISWKLDT